MATEEILHNDKSTRYSGGKLDGSTTDGIILFPRTDEGWNPLNPENLAYSSASVLTVSGFDPRDYLQAGDQFRLRQGGTNKYFYVIDLSATTITLNAGDDYTIANATVQAAAFARGTGLGHPGKFVYTPDISCPIGSGTVNAASRVEYQMTGPLVKIVGLLVLNMSVDFEGIIEIGYPFSLRSDISTQLGSSLNMGEPGAVADFVQYFYGLDAIASPLDLAHFTVGAIGYSMATNFPLTNSFYIDFSYFY